MRKNACLVFLLVMCGSVSASAEEEATFFDKGEEGWFWYQDPEPEPEPEEPEEPVEVAKPTPPVEPSPEPAPSAPPGSVAWLRDAIPAALDFATDDPTPENVERYFLLQQQALNKAEKFSEMAGLVTTGHPVLDESRRRPRADRFAKLQDEEASEAETVVLERLFQESAIVLFLDARCSGCSLMARNLYRMSTIHGLVWRVVSMDGTVLPEDFDVETTFDNGISEQLGVEAGGAMFLATPPNRFDAVSWNATSGTEVIERILRVAYRSELISEDEYRSTRPVAPMLADVPTLPTNDLPDILRAADDLLVSHGIRIDNPSKGEEQQ